MNTLRNDLSASKKKMIIYLLGFLTIGGAVGMAFPEYLHPQWAMVALSAVSAFFLLLNLIGNHHYLWVLVENEKLKIRYYSILGFLRKYQAIEIPLQAFNGYKINTKFAGLRRELILQQRVKSKVGTYPPVFISTLSNKEYNALIALLNRHSKK